jgi:hypothetical protein
VHEDKQKLIDATIKMMVLTDEKRWQDLKDLFANPVVIDYTSLTGGQPLTLDPSVIITEWKKSLNYLTTHHMISNHLIGINEKQATVKAYFQATHYLHNSYGDDKWTLGGKYDFTFLKDGDSWKISKLTMTAIWGTGNQNIMSLARSRYDAESSE